MAGLTIFNISAFQALVVLSSRTTVATWTPWQPTLWRFVRRSLQRHCKLTPSWRTQFATVVSALRESTFVVHLRASSTSAQAAGKTGTVCHREIPTTSLCAEAWRSVASATSHPIVIITRFPSPPFFSKLWTSLPSHRFYWTCVFCPVGHNWRQLCARVCVNCASFSHCLQSFIIIIIIINFDTTHPIPPRHCGQ